MVPLFTPRTSILICRSRRLGTSPMLNAEKMGVTPSTDHRSMGIRSDKPSMSSESAAVHHNTAISEPARTYVASLSSTRFADSLEPPPINHKVYAPASPRGPEARGLREAHTCDHFEARNDQRTAVLLRHVQRLRTLEGNLTLAFPDANAMTFSGSSARNGLLTVRTSNA